MNFSYSECSRVSRIKALAVFFSLLLCFSDMPFTTKWKGLKKEDRQEKILIIKTEMVKEGLVGLDEGRQ